VALFPKSSTRTWGHFLIDSPEEPRATEEIPVSVRLHFSFLIPSLGHGNTEEEQGGCLVVSTFIHLVTETTTLTDPFSPFSEESLRL